jgi:hypothetical protein
MLSKSWMSKAAATPVVAIALHRRPIGRRCGGCGRLNGGDYAQLIIELEERSVEQGPAHRSEAPAGRWQRVGSKISANASRYWRIASLEIEHATVEMVIEQLGRKPRTSFGSEDCNLNQIPRDYTMQITMREE